MITALERDTALLIVIDEGVVCTRFPPAESVGY